MNTALDGRTELIVGANGGIGRAVAHALGAAGAGLDAAEVTSRVVPADVTDDDSVRALVEDAAPRGMDIAVNNAGAAHRPVPLADLALSDIDRVLRVALGATLVSMHYALAALPDGGSTFQPDRQQSRFGEIDDRQANICPTRVSAVAVCAPGEALRLPSRAR